MTRLSGGIDYSYLPITLTPEGNFRQSIEERFAGAAAIASLAVRTASGNTPDINVARFLYGDSCIDVVTFTGMVSCDIFLEGKDITLGKYRTLHTRNFTGIGTDWLSVTMLAFELVRARWVINTPGANPSITFGVGFSGKV